MWIKTFFWRKNWMMDLIAEDFHFPSSLINIKDPALEIQIF